MNLVIFFVLLPFVYGYGRHMPNYIKACPKSKMSTCAIENAKAAYPTIIKGDPEYDIPNLSPFHIAKLEMDADDMVLKFENLIIEGLEHLDFKAMDFDLNNKKGSIQFFIETLYFQGHYEGAGKAYVMILKGSGNSNITFVGGTYDYSFEWDEKNINGEEHLVLKNTKLKFKVERAHFDFENLEGKDFQGDEVNTNEILNEYWDMILEEVEDKIANTIEKIITGIIVGYFEHIPLSEMFL